MSDTERCTVRIDSTGNGMKSICNKPILTMAYKGTGACGEAHLKIKNNDYEGTVSAKPRVG